MKLFITRPSILTMLQPLSHLRFFTNAFENVLPIFGHDNHISLLSQVPLGRRL
eukprot:c46958_g1_i1 orf=79-237(+)